MIPAPGHLFMPSFAVVLFLLPCGGGGGDRHGCTGRSGVKDGGGDGGGGGGGDGGGGGTSINMTQVVGQLHGHVGCHYGEVGWWC